MAPDPAFPPQTQSDNSSLGPGSSASPNSNSSELFLFGARLEFDAHIREYDSLQSEVHARISKQQDITSFAIALIAGFAALTQVLPARPHLELTSPQILPLYPAIALILSAFALMTLDHELNIALIYKYIDRILRPQTEKLLRMAAGHPSPCWNWNQVRAYEQHHAGASTLLNASMAGSKYAITIMPSLAALIFYFSARSSRLSIPLWENVLFALASMVVAAAMLGATYAGLIYWQMPHSRMPSKSHSRPSV